jgi:hypothetical protein
MNILADEVLMNHFSTKFADLNEKDFYIVQLEQAVPGHHLQDVCGLDQALEVAPTGKPVVILGWMPIHMYIDKFADKWFAVNGYPNVIFLLMLATSQEVLAAVEEVEAGNRSSDALAVALFGVAQTNSDIGCLHHDISSAQRDTERMAQWEKKAREIFGDKSREELIATITEASKTRHLSGKFAGQKFHDVCVDVEGTILTTDGQIRPEVIALAEQKAQGGPITVWTGGDTHKLSQQLRNAGILYKITSKETMRGATVRVVIDDQPEDAFKSDYGIGYEEYVQI